jgi:hypothetical protein
VNDHPLPSRLRRAAAASGRVAASAVLVAALAAGCAQAGGSPTPPVTPPTPSAPAAPVGSPAHSPATSPAPSPATSPAPPSAPAIPPVTRPLTADEAVALVLASDPRFGSIRPRDIGVIGQSAWYEVRPAGTGYVVTVSIGWGDCPAGCIERRTWVYSVSENGVVELVSTSGDDGPPAGGAPGASGSGASGGSGGSGGSSGGAASNPPGAAGTGTVAGMVLAGPVCPVVQSPPDPACADRPVVGAVVVALDASGREVARASSGEDGRYRIPLPAGTYTLVPQHVDGLMGTASTVIVEVRTGSTTMADLAYDTGIR